MRVASALGCSARARATISAMAKDSSRSPSWLAAETVRTCSPRASKSWQDDVGEVAAVGDVDLVERDQPGPVRQAAVRRQLVLDHVEVGDRVAPGLHGGGVDDVDQRGAPLDVAQEVVAEAAALAGALDEAGDVGDGEGGVAGRDHAEVGHQRGERVVGDLRPRPRQRRDEAGLAGAGEADQPDVGHHLELEDHGQLVAGLAEQREAGGLALGGGERGVAETAAAALRPAPSRCPGRRGRPAPCPGRR